MCFNLSDALAQFVIKNLCDTWRKRYFLRLKNISLPFLFIPIKRVYPHTYSTRVAVIVALRRIHLRVNRRHLEWERGKRSSAVLTVEDSQQVGGVESIEMVSLGVDRQRRGRSRSLRSPPFSLELSSCLLSVQPNHRGSALTPPFAPFPLSLSLPLSSPFFLFISFFIFSLSRGYPSSLELRAWLRLLSSPCLRRASRELPVIEFFCIGLTFEVVEICFRSLRWNVGKFFILCIDGSHGLRHFAVESINAKKYTLVNLISLPS